MGYKKISDDIKEAVLLTTRSVVSLVSQRGHWGELKHRKTSLGALPLESQLVKEDLGFLLAKMLSISCTWHDTSQQHFLMSTDTASNAFVTCLSALLPFIGLWSVLAWISSRCRRWLLGEIPFDKLNSFTISCSLPSVYRQGVQGWLHLYLVMGKSTYWAAHGTA